jgi:hypothetical protein
MTRSSRRAAGLLLAALILLFIASATAVEAGITGDLLGVPAGAVAFLLSLAALGEGLLSAASSSVGRSG